jgi:4,5-dihydroxyphthalate decarboxylase
MTALKLKIATVPYDRVTALRTGEVAPEGIELDYVAAIPAHSIFVRMAERHEFDVSEMSLALYSTLRARGEFPFVALPVFPSRVFRHGNIFVNRASGIETPKQLEGRRIGIQEYRQTALIWVRGMLREDHGVDTSAIEWVEGGINSPRRLEASDVRPLGPVSISYIGPDKTISDAVASGELPAAISARQPDSLRFTDKVARLFPDWRAEERDYFQRTGNFPIMHTVVMREELYEKEPWIAQSLYVAFERAKAHAARMNRYTGVLMNMVPWLHEELDEADAVFGGDPFPYGLESNRGPLETFMRHLVGDGLLASEPAIEDLFAPVEEGTGREDAYIKGLA